MYFYVLKTWQIGKKNPHITSVMCYYTPESDSETFFFIKNHSDGNLSLKFRKTSQNDDIGSKCTIELDINLKY